MWKQPRQELRFWPYLPPHEAAPTSSQFIVGVGNDLLDRVMNGLIVCQVIDDPVKPNIKVSGLQSWNLPLKSLVDLGMRF